VINILIAIIINSVEEVHEAERAELRADIDAEVAAGDASVADRLQSMRNAIDELEEQLAHGLAPTDGEPRSVRRPTKGGRMRG
jgi:hypothetical protein